jgi:hypothetical protein
MIEADIVGRWIQREVYVQDQIRALCKSLELAPDSEKDAHCLNMYEQELKALNDRYLLHRRWMWMLEYDVPDGPLERASPLRKSAPQYSLSWLK